MTTHTEQPKDVAGATDGGLPLDDWDVEADGIPVRKGDHVTEEDGELVYLHSDGRETRFV
jgi:hypothetical protein